MTDILYRNAHLTVHAGETYRDAAAVAATLGQTMQLGSAEYNDVCEARQVVAGNEEPFGWTDADEAQFQADMARIDAKIKSEARRGKVEEQEQRTDA